MKDTSKDPARPRKKPGRVPVACAECRRLKLKCDRKVPCGKCEAKGCAAICPDGALVHGQGNRLVLANTEELHERIGQLCQRVRQLEDALRVLQASMSTQPHPLLSDELLRLKAPSFNMPDFEQSSTPPNEEDEKVMDSSGTMYMGPNGQSQYFGGSARSEFLIDEEREADFPPTYRLPGEFYAYSWPEPLPPNKDLQASVAKYLPSPDEARHIIEHYLQCGQWLGTSMAREQIEDELIRPIYANPGAPAANTCPHALALFFMILALGALWDPDRPSYNAEAEDYYRCARVALSIRSPIFETTSYAIQAMNEIVRYLEACHTPKKSALAWTIMGIALKLASNMGLHRDSAQWHLENTVCDRRQTVFWQCYSMEVYQCLNLCRPVMISEEHADCPLIYGDTDLRGPDVPYFVWNLHFTRLLRRISDVAFCAPSPSYSTIANLSQKVLEFPVPPWLDVGLQSGGSLHEVLQRWCVRLSKDHTLLHLNRYFLIRALTDDSREFLKSKYADSVTTCHTGAISIIEGLQRVYAYAPKYVGKVGIFFSAAITAAVIMCIIVTKAPASDLATTSMEKLDAIYDILDKGAAHNLIARRNLEATQKLRHYAREAFNRARTRFFAAFPQPQYDDQPELDRLSGKTTLMPKVPPTVSIASNEDTAQPTSPIDDLSGYTVHNFQPFDSWASQPNAAGSAQPFVANPQGRGMARPMYASEPQYPAADFMPQGFDTTWQHFIQQLGF